MIKKREIKNTIFERSAAAAFYLLAAILLFIIGKIFVEGIRVIDFNFLFGKPEAGLTGGGIGPAIFGTVAVAVLMVIIALPLGVFSAVYLSEFTSGGLFSRMIRLAIKFLAGVPSIVFGLFGLGFFVLFVGKSIDNALDTGMIFGQPAMLWASATLAVLVLPTVIVSTFEALRAVPESHRRAAYALGASQWQMVAKTVVPQARAGILTGAIFAVSRAIGETAPVLFIGCALFLPGLPSADLCILGICIPMINPFSEFMYLSYHLFILSTQSPNPSAMHSLQYGTALVLLVMTVALNSIAIYFRYRFRKTIGS